MTNKCYLAIKNESVRVCRSISLKHLKFLMEGWPELLKKDKEGKPGEDLRGEAPSDNNITEDEKIMDKF